MALTGFLNNNICHSTLSSAMNAHYSSINTIAGNPFYTFDNLTGSWSISQAGVLSPAPSNIFPSCDPTAAFTDGLTVAYLVLGVMVTAIIWKQLQRAAT